MLHFFIAEIMSKVSQLLPSLIVFKIFSKRLMRREQRKLVLTHFSLENILSSLALGTETVNKNLIINNTSLQPLPLVAVKVLCHVTRYITLVRERVFFVYSTNLCHLTEGWE